MSHPDFAPGVGQIGPKTAEPPAEIRKTDPKPATTDLTDIIGSKPRRSTKNGTIEEEEAPIAKTLKPKSTDDAPAVPEEPKPDAAPATVAANPDDPDDALDKNGKPKKKVRSLLENLTGPDDKPVKPEVEKKEENPFAPKIVSVTATEPKVMPLELDRIAGNDKTLTQQVVVLFPDWRVRDAQFENSKIGIPHMGRDKVVSLTPMNDSLPAKLVATVEIPKSFALQRPTLLFEVSNLVATGKDWTLSVKAMGVEMLPKTKIKLTKDAPWQDMAIDLSPLADRHFDLQIEVSSSVKHPKGGATEVGFIRNVRIEWVGKKK